MKLRSGAPRWFDEDHPEKQAKCIGFPATKEYDPWYGDIDYGDDEEAKQDNELIHATYICHGEFDGIQCPLLGQCLDFAMTNNERYGVWGGMTPDERAELRKERRSLNSKRAGDQSSLVD